MTPAIAIVGMACEFPDARSPEELWENVLAQRQAFRRIPAERLRAEDYFSSDPATPDHTYAFEAALIEGYEFDRELFRVAGSTFRSADLAHWLALDVASRALVDAGFPEGHGLPRDTTGVFLGNTLTGEFSRANLMRLRWPYVRRMVEAALSEEGRSLTDRRDFLESLETRYKAPFPPVGEESLAGGMSNTIAGRICNHFDLKGGGYAVDGACASSLLSLGNACSALMAGDIDVALAGGVDLSVDPFELVGFAKAGALATDEMRVFDARSAGFWPGEGCGFLVLMRYQEAIEKGQRIYAVVRGWGVSSDGSGGITRPEFEGQLLALHRAYRRAGFGIETVPYFEGHGTGTSIGDSTELRTLTYARREAGDAINPAAIGSVKANIGHTKAAAGVAGLIKAAMALHTQTLPPTTGCQQPHPELSGEAPALRVLSDGEAWPTDLSLRAGVSAMGFGGINTHVVLEGAEVRRREKLGTRDRRLLDSAQDAELFLLGGKDGADLRGQVAHLLTLARRLSRSDLSDLAGALESKLVCRQIRAAVIAATPEELAQGLEYLSTWLSQGVTSRLDLLHSVYLGSASTTPRVGFLFPGQGSPVHYDGGALRRRLPCVRSLYERVRIPAHSESVATEVVQPGITTASLAGLRILDALRIKADVGVGHSLGELAALSWAGALDEKTTLRIARARGKVMAELSAKGGSMASIAANEAKVAKLVQGGSVEIAGMNAPLQTVISGAADQVHEVVNRAREQGLTAVKLPVSHAFHSQLVAPAAAALAKQLALEEFGLLRRTVVSTVTGTPLNPKADLRALLYQQVTSPVRFTQAVLAAKGMDLFIEVGPGQVLSGLVSEFIDAPAISLDAGGPSLKGVLKAVGAAFALGVDVNHSLLFTERFTRPFDINWYPSFFANPCELAPLPEANEVWKGMGTAREGDEAEVTAVYIPAISGDSALELVRQLVAEHTELPVAAVHGNHRMLSDLHLNSIAVSQLVVQAARKLGLSPPMAPTDFSNVRVADLAQTLEELLLTSGTASASEYAPTPSGVDAWVRAFTVELVERSLPRSKSSANAVAGAWQVIGPGDHPLIWPLQQAFSGLGGGGVVVCLPPRPDESHLALLLEGTRALMASKDLTRFVLVQHGQGAASFARTLYLEAPELTTCVVNVPPDHPNSVNWVVTEAMAAEGYTEAHYDLSGQRRVPVLTPLPLGSEAAKIPLGSDDVLLITGGGKGISTECALELARKTGVRLGLMGRSKPNEDTELAANLERIAASGVEWLYVSADVTDAEAVRAAVDEVEAALGSVTAILHSAGVNTPKPIFTLEEADFHDTVAPKVQGARNLLSSVDPARLRFFIIFGSVIARTGFRGEADYGVANEWLTDLTQRWQDAHPTCHCLAIEWSLWSGVGMGARLGRVESMAQQGITAITPDQGARIFCHLLAQYGKGGSTALPVSVVVTGRFGETPTLEVAQPELPYLRFLEWPRVHYPGVELVVDAELSATSDPYLDDHVFQGNRIFPAVMGLEAMAQAAMALAGTEDTPEFRDVKFIRPVVVPDNGTLTIRVAALARESGEIEVVLRSEETSFQVDYFQAKCWPGVAQLPVSDRQTCPQDYQEEPAPVAIEPSRDLYGGILFHGGRFQRLQRYFKLRAKECLAEITGGGEPTDWFARYLPAELVLGDPGARDAAIHAVQACIPHATLLPIGVHRVQVGIAQALGDTVVWAKERAREGDTFIYDLEVSGADGRVQERWEGLQLRCVTGTEQPGAWPEGLLGPYIERRTQEIIPGAQLSVAVDMSAGDDRRCRSERAIQRALGRRVAVHTRPDGKPWVDGNYAVSASHAGNLTFAVAGPGPIACDAEPVHERPIGVWEDLLGTEGFALAEVIARQVDEEITAAATRVWVAKECLKKAGAMVSTPLVLFNSSIDGWVSLKAGLLAITTVIVPVRGVEADLTVAVLVGIEDAHI